MNLELTPDQCARRWTRIHRLLMLNQPVGPTHKDGSRCFRIVTENGRAYGVSRVITQDTGKRLTVTPHRFILEAKLGRPLDTKGGEQVNHTCGMPTCGNPEHIVLGSRHSDRGPQRKAHVRLTQPQRKALFFLRLINRRVWTIPVLSALFHVTTSTVHRVIREQRAYYAQDGDHQRAHRIAACIAHRVGANGPWGPKEHTSYHEKHEATSDPALDELLYFYSE